MKNSLLKRILVFITVSSIIAQSFSPYVAILSQRAYAQEVTDQTTTTETQTTTVEQVTPAPENTNPTPSEEQVAPTEEVTPVPTDTPTEEVTPVPTDTPTEVTPSEVNNNSPPAENTSENQGIDTSITPTETPVTLSPTQEGLTTATENPKDEQLNLIVLDNVSAPSIDLEAVEESGSAALTTDKPDYAPTDAALITGSNLLPNTTYTLRVWSDDEPATSTTVNVTSDENGVFAYAYQLDGTYRPNYSAELKDSSGNVVATITFTDSPISGCQNDSGGANDEPGQKDLTKMCVNYSSLPTSVSVDWNWDEKDPGGNIGGNTGDACSLFDTDGDGLINYSLCVIIDGDPSVYQSKVLYSCGDAKADRCTSPVTTISPSASTTCTANVQNTDPFLTGDDYPQDSVATCNIALSDVGGSGVAELVDVCSYPSQQPNSDPSDCIVFKDNTGRIEVIKDLIPSSDTGLFNLQIDSVTQAANVGDAGTTGEKVVNVGDRTVGETAGTATSLSDYTTTIVCKALNGSGSIVAQSSNAGPLTVPVVEGDDIVCTITNTRSTATITVNKTLSPSNDPGLFNLQVDGNTAGTGANVGNGGTTGSINVNTSGTHTVSETAGTATSLSDYTTTWTCNNNTSGNGTSAGPFSLTANQNLDCTFTNTRNTGSVLVNKLVDTNGDGTYEGGNTEANNLGFSWSLDTLGTNNFGSTVSSINTGSHNVNENLNGQPYHFVGWYLTSDTSKTCANTTNTTLPANISVASGQTTAITLCNARNTGTVTVYKDVQGPNGENIIDTSNNFTVQLDGSDSQSITDNGSVTYNNVPTGNHTVTESLVALGYTLYGISETPGAVGTPAGLSISVSSDATTHVYVTNRQNPATITVEKVVKDSSGQTVSDNHTFTVQLNGGNDDSTLADNNNVVYNNITPGGPYTVSEVTDPNYDNLGCKLASGAAATGFSVTPGEQVTVTCTNQQKPGSISGYKFQSDGSTPIADWGIKLFTCTTSDFLTCVQSATTTTNGSGFYSFINLVAGFYKVVEDFVDGFTPVSVTSHNVTINPNTQSENNNFSNFKNINITVCKEDTNQNRISGWEMTLNVDNVASGNAQQTDENGCYTFTNLGPNHSYSVTEEDRSGWNPVSDPSFTHDFGQPVDGQNINYTFVNVQLGTIIVKKVMVGGTGSFDFTGDVAGTISVNNGTLTTNNVLPGTYTSTEGTENGWTLDSIVCNDTTNGGTSSTGNLNDRTVTFNVHAGESVTCTFTNTKLPTLKVIKLVNNNNGGTLNPDDFTLYVKDSNEEDVNGSPFQGSNAGELFTLPLGSYTVSEDSESGYTGTISGDCNTEGEVTLTAGQDATCTITNDDQSGHLIVHKLTNPSNDQTEFDITLSSQPASGNANRSLSTSSDVDYEVNAGTYSVTESVKTGWDETSNTCEDVAVANGETKECTITNTKRVRITVEKVTEPSEADDSFNFVLGGDADDETTLKDGQSHTFENLVSGAFTITEEAVEGWNLANIDCGDNVSYGINGNFVTLVTDPGDDVVCTFTNEQDGKIIVTKYNDRNGNGQQDEGEEVLEDWNINVDQTQQSTDENGETTFNVEPGQHVLSEEIQNGWEQTNISCDAPETEVTPTPTPTDEGTAVCHWNEGADKWNAIDPGAAGAQSHLSNHEDDYPYEGEDSVPSKGADQWCEDNDPRDISLTSQVLASFVGQAEAQEQNIVIDNDNDHPVAVEPGQTVNCTIGNHNLTPVLTISKENDAVGNKSAGDEVTYTITLTLDEEGGPAENLIVTDLLPKGFVYKNGSWQVLLNGNPIVVGEPTYASPGTWTLGSADAGDVFTLIYKATIDGSTQTGTYYDNAWGEGTAIGSSDVILASAVNPGQLDDTFVGTDVSVVNGNVAGVDYKATSTREVLGASTFLPATGENTLWVIIATLLMGLGLGTTLVGIKLRKKYE